MGDTLSAAGASRLAVRIQIYWASRGLSGVRAWAEPLPAVDENGKPATVFQVRSNIEEKLRERRGLVTA